MVTTTEIVTEKERRYGIGYRPASKVNVEKRFVDESIFVPEKEEVVVEKRIFAPHKTENTVQTAVAEKKAEVETITGLSVKSKLVLGLYVGVAFMLSVIATIAGIVIGNNVKTVAALEGQVRTANAIVRVQEAQIDELSSETNIEQRAKESGMVDTKISGEVTLLNLSENEQASNSNVFDTFCDWFSGIIGG